MNRHQFDPDSPPRKRLRRFHPTLNRMLLSLLPVRGGLFLCEHFRWLTKGYSVVFAAASVLVVVVFLLLGFAIALLFRWRFQYSLRTLLLLTVIVSIWCSWFAVQMQHARRQRAVAEAIKNCSGWVAYGYQLDQKPNAQPPGPAWLHHLLGVDFLSTIIDVRLGGSPGHGCRAGAAERVEQTTTFGSQRHLSHGRWA